MQGIDNLPKGGGSSTLSGLSDVNFSSLTQGDLLIYDGAEWINHSFTEGHKILDESGTAVTARDNLQFTDGLKVTDDSGNSKTKVGVNTTFTEASTRANINSGDTFSTILGKIKKWFTDIPSLFVSKTGDTMTGRLFVSSTSNDTYPIIADRTHTDTTVKSATVRIGNNKADGTAGATVGILQLYGNGASRTEIWAPDSTTNRTIKLPNSSGTVALTSEVDEKVSKSGDAMSGRLTVKSASGDSYAIVADRNHLSTISTNVTIIIGNDVADGTAGSTYGVLRLYGKGSKRTEISAPNSTNHRSIECPDASGTLLLTSDISVSAFASSASDTYHAIYDLHSNLSNGQRCACILTFGSINLYVTGYRRTSTSGRYVALGMTWDEVMAYRVDGNTVYQNTITGTITSSTIN